jgi:hypothetical protein
MLFKILTSIDSSSIDTFINSYFYQSSLIDKSKNLQKHGKGRVYKSMTKLRVYKSVYLIKVDILLLSLFEVKIRKEE